MINAIVGENDASTPEMMLLLFPTTASMASYVHPRRLLLGTFPTLLRGSSKPTSTRHGSYHGLPPLLQPGEASARLCVDTGAAPGAALGSQPTLLRIAGPEHRCPVSPGR
jgi:hypothetical protein